MRRCSYHHSPPAFCPIPTLMDYLKSNYEYWKSHCPDSPNYSEEESDTVSHLLVAWLSSNCSVTFLIILMPSRDIAIVQFPGTTSKGSRGARFSPPLTVLVSRGSYFIREGGSVAACYLCQHKAAFSKGRGMTSVSKANIMASV